MYIGIGVDFNLVLGLVVVIDYFVVDFGKWWVIVVGVIEYVVVGIIVGVG